MSFSLFFLRSLLSTLQFSLLSENSKFSQSQQWLQQPQKAFQNSTSMPISPPLLLICSATFTFSPLNRSPFHSSLSLSVYIFVCFCIKTCKFCKKVFTFICIMEYNFGGSVLFDLFIEFLGWWWCGRLSWRSCC